MSEEQEERQAQGEEGHELGVRRWHSVPLPMHLFGSLLLQNPLQSKVESFARHLSSKHHEYLDFAGRPDQGCVYHAETLWHKGQPGAEVGDGIVGILQRSAQHWKTRGQSYIMHMRQGEGRKRSGVSHESTSAGQVGKQNNLRSKSFGRLTLSCPLRISPCETCCRKIETKFSKNSSSSEPA